MRAPATLVCLVMTIGLAPAVADSSDGVAGARPGLRQRVWVAVEDGHRVVKVNLRSRKVMTHRGVPGAPHNLTVGRRGTVATALWGDGRVALVRSGRVRSVYLGGGPHDVKIARGRLVVANQGAARLEVLNLKGRVRGRIGLKANPPRSGDHPRRRQSVGDPGGQRAVGHPLVPSNFQN